jgi:hypothetical protein
LSALVDALEFLPQLLVIDPLGLTIALPYLLKAVMHNNNNNYYNVF